MSVCPKCGTEVGSAPFCTNCGQIIQKEQFESYQSQPSAVTEASQNYAAPQSHAAPQPVAPVPTGGLIAWSIVTLLLCTIPGIVGLVQACGINKTYTVEDQQKKIKSCKTWNTVGCILGGIYLILSIIATAV